MSVRSSVDSGHGQWSWAGTALLSEVATIQVEFITLSKRTGNPYYADQVTKVRTAQRCLSGQAVLQHNSHQGWGWGWGP